MSLSPAGYVAPCFCFVFFAVELPPSSSSLPPHTHRTFGGVAKWSQALTSTRHLPGKRHGYRNEERVNPQGRVDQVESAGLARVKGANETGRGPRWAHECHGEGRRRRRPPRVSAQGLATRLGRVMRSQVEGPTRRRLCFLHLHALNSALFSNEDPKALRPTSQSSQAC